jgi:pullulanase
LGLDVSAARAVGGQELFELYYPGDDMGAVYSTRATSFRVFAPTALGVSCILYPSPTASTGREIPMAPDCDGTWTTTVHGDLAGTCYTYRVNLGGAVNEAPDPYARALTLNGERGVVVDLDRTDPPGWTTDRRPPFRHAVDAVIYEVHVRDYSASEYSGMTHKGKYLAFTEPGALDHLVDLGVTHVHLLPVQDFASVDEAAPDEYNWGYDPHHFYVPEGSYSTNPADPTCRITEVKQMVQAFHARGIRVVMDVVYNHTYTVDGSPLHQIVPNYYHRTNAAGQFTNGSGCGNELATERPMVRKLILDSLKYWMDEYHVDGFRFDLMALLDYHTVREISAELRSLDPTVLLYGEPWAGGVSGLCPSQLFTKGRQRGLGIALFNDGLRNAVKGDTDGPGLGFVSGAPHREGAIRRGIAGSVAYDTCSCDFAAEPGETINYVSCHDNLTLWDKLAKSCPQDSEEDRIRMDLLAQAVILLSQGIPFIHGGEELLRTKHGNHNSYNAGDLVNQIDWSRKKTYPHVFAYYRGLIALRRAHPAFRMTQASQIVNHLRFHHSPANTVSFVLDGHPNGDPWRNIMVILNANRHPVEIGLPGTGPWRVVVEGMKAGTRTRRMVLGPTVSVAPISAMVLHQ